MMRSHDAMYIRVKLCDIPLAPPVVLVVYNSSLNSLQQVAPSAQISGQQTCVTIIWLAIDAAASECVREITRVHDSDRDELDTYKTCKDAASMESSDKLTESDFHLSHRCTI